MVENCFSSGVATEAAMVSGLAPGRLRRDLMVGKSTRGSAATGSCDSRTMPATTNDSISSMVITGRRMQGSASSSGDLRLPTTLGLLCNLLLGHLLKRARHPAATLADRDLAAVRETQLSVNDDG